MKTKQSKTRHWLSLSIGDYKPKINVNETFTVWESMELDSVEQHIMF